MKNIDVIRQLPCREIAKLLIKEAISPIDYEEDTSVDITYYTTHGHYFLTFDDAVDSEVEWLLSDYKKS